jgi:hypothetical protein
MKDDTSQSNPGLLKSSGIPICTILPKARRMNALWFLLLRVAVPPHPHHFTNMPLTYDIDAERQLMTVVGSGRLSLADVIEHQRQVSDDSRITPGLRVLTDLREITGLDLAGREVLNLAQTRGDFPVLGTYGPTAVVATDPILVGMARMYMLSRRKFIQPMAVFATEEEAVAWLDRVSANAPAEKQE